MRLQAAARFSDFVQRPDSKALEDKNTMFRKLDLFLSSCDGETLLCWVPLERANFTHWTSVFIF
jgi:hypothetical protein